LFARVSGGIVISGRLIRPVEGRNKRTRAFSPRKHIHFRRRKKEWRAGLAEHAGLRRRDGPEREKGKKDEKGEKLA
jgi:hypothetical protein